MWDSRARLSNYGMTGGGAGPTRAGPTRLFQIACMFLLWRICVAKVVIAAIFFLVLHYVRNDGQVMRSGQVKQAIEFVIWNPENDNQGLNFRGARIDKHLDACNDDVVECRSFFM